jgi:NADPH:quinone reductase-like Zn-dependent oxidoreductase
LAKAINTLKEYITMVERNATNTIEFNTQEFGAPVSYFTIDTGASLANETNPGEAVEAIVELIARKGTILAMGTESNGAFRVAIENNTWTQADLEAALQGLGATVGTNNYDATGATVADFVF